MTDRARISFAKPRPRLAGTVVVLAGPDAGARAGGHAARRRGADPAGGGDGGLHRQGDDHARPDRAGRYRPRPADRGRHRQARRTEGEGLAPPRRGGDGRARQGQGGDGAPRTARRPEARRRTRRPTSPSACGFAATPSTSTRSRRTTTASERQPVELHHCRRRAGAAQERLGGPLRRSPTASMLARDLVNEPANVLGPVEFADAWRGARHARRRGRGARREGPEEARHGRAPRRRPGLGAAAAGRRSCAGTAARRRTSRSPSSARAWSSTPAASRSSRPPAWRT